MYAIGRNVTAFKSSGKHNGFLIVLNLTSIQLSKNDEIPCEILIFMKSLKLMKLKMLIFRWTCDKKMNDDGSGLQKTPSVSKLSIFRFSFLLIIIVVF